MAIDNLILRYKLLNQWVEPTITRCDENLGIKQEWTKYNEILWNCVTICDKDVWVKK